MQQQLLTMEATSYVNIGGIITDTGTTKRDDIYSTTGTNVGIFANPQESRAGFRHCTDMIQTIPSSMDCPNGAHCYQAWVSSAPSRNAVFSDRQCGAESIVMAASYNGPWPANVPHRSNNTKQILTVATRSFKKSGPRPRLQYIQPKIISVLESITASIRHSFV
jgi:hypothetical protein